jgi:hypothetical protein
MAASSIVVIGMRGFDGLIKPTRRSLTSDTLIYPDRQPEREPAMEDSAASSLFESADQSFGGGAAGGDGWCVHIG